MNILWQSVKENTPRNGTASIKRMTEQQIQCTLVVEVQQICIYLG